MIPDLLSGPTSDVSLAEITRRDSTWDGARQLAIIPSGNSMSVQVRW